MLTLNSSSCPNLNTVTSDPNKSYNSGNEVHETKSIELISNQTDDQLGTLKRSKEKSGGLSSLHIAPFKYLKRSPQDLGLKTSYPLNQK